jgi:hypothetical protein
LQQYELEYLAYIGGMRLEIIRSTEFGQVMRRRDEFMKDFKSKTPLPGWFIRVEKSNKEGQEYFTFSDQQRIVLVDQNVNDSKETNGCRIERLI